MSCSESPSKELAAPDSESPVPVILRAARRQPLLPAWARLLVYVPTAVVVFVIGQNIGAIPGLIAVMAGEEWKATRLEPGGDPFAQLMELSLKLVAAMPTWAIVVLMYASYMPVVGVSLLSARLLDRRTLAEFGLSVRPDTRRHLSLGVLLGATVVPQTLVYAAMRLVVLHRTEHSWIESLIYGLVLFGGVGFWEEVIFRGYLLPNLAELIGRGWAIWVSSLVFGAVHLVTPEVRHLPTVLGLVLVGVLFCLCYYATGSLWLGIALHGAYDCLLLSIFQPHSQVPVPSVYSTELLAPKWLVGPPGQAGAADLAYLLVLIAIVYFWLYRPAVQAERARAVGTGIMC